MTTPSPTRELCLQRLAACLSATFAISATAIPAQAYGVAPAVLTASLADRLPMLLGPLTSSVIRNVVSCADDGSVGTLRQVIGISGDNDYIELSGLGCSTISLTSGEIATAHDGLTLHGRPDNSVTITTGATNRLLHHTGTGDFTIDHLTLTDGKYLSSTGNAEGGCVYSAGSVKVTSSVVSGCEVSVTKPSGGAAAHARGGAIYAKHSIQVLFSRITGNYALASNSNEANGGALYTFTSLFGYYATISGNVAVGLTADTSAGVGGAAVVYGTVYLVNSTVDSNVADVGGAMFQRASSGADKVRLLSCTISGNTANVLTGAIDASSKVEVVNSTVAFNSAHTGAAIIVSFANVKAYSSILARNSSATGGFADLYIKGAPAATLNGSNNLIVSSNLGLPDTLTADPMLGPLANHGGQTRTHALNPLSPVIDKGLATSPFDQRGAGFQRAVPAGSPDIGAYERQLIDDEIFYGGFD